MKQYLNEFIDAAKEDSGILLDAANQFYDADRADIAFILAEAVSACDSKSRNAGLIMVRIFNLLHLSGMNEIQLLEQFENNNSQEGLRPITSPAVNIDDTQGDYNIFATPEVK